MTKEKWYREVDRVPFLLSGLSDKSDKVFLSMEEVAIPGAFAVVKEAMFYYTFVVNPRE